MPPAAHFVYIPAVMLVGIVIGFILGTRAAKDQEAQRARREAERQERRASRQPKKE